jgi:hypothetical protein
MSLSFQLNDSSPGETSLNVHHKGQFIPLSSIVRQQLKKQKERLKAIILCRCEPLPDVEADEGEMNELFTLLFTILFHSSNNQKPILFHLEVGAFDIISRTGTDFVRYQLNFKSSVQYDPIWIQQYHAEILRCKDILSHHNGELVLNLHIKSGCLFSIIIPGK